MASILSEEENTFVGAISKGAKVWIGGTDGAFEGAWTWSDGSPWRYAKWNPGEPNDVHSEDCLEVSHNHWAGHHAADHWNDVQCGASQHYICKRPQYSDDAEPTKGTWILNLRGSHMDMGFGSTACPGPLHAITSEAECRTASEAFGGFARSESFAHYPSGCSVCGPGCLETASVNKLFWNAYSGGASNKNHAPVCKPAGMTLRVRACERT